MIKKSCSTAKVKEKVAEVEEKNVADLRALLGNQHPDFRVKEFDDLTLRRFIRARDFDVEKASSMLMKYLKWRRSFVPNGSISTLEITNQLAQNKMLVQGIDKRGCPIVLVLGAKGDEYQRFLVYTLDKICSRIPNGEESFIIIQDLQGCGLANNDFTGFMEALTIFQIVFVGNKKLESSLLEEIDQNQLAEIYGGKMKLVPIQDA